MRTMVEQHISCNTRYLVSSGEILRRAITEIRNSCGGCGVGVGFRGCGFGVGCGRCGGGGVGDGVVVVLYPCRGHTLGVISNITAEMRPLVYLVYVSYSYQTYLIPGISLAECSYP